jgi:beta-aspartyl-peptidase (threonine type)
MGIVEVDACIMDGRLRAGAVGAVPWMRHPITLARHLLEAEEHVFLVGGGALLYAREHGLPAGDPPDSMIAPRARLRFQASQTPSSSGGTIGACAVDRKGRVAAATSTGGTAGKRPGRVGDSPLVGGGNFADDEAGAASATGHGEAILRVCMTRFAVDLMRGGESAADAARLSVEEVKRRTETDVGIILVGRDGSVGHHTGTARMPWAAVAGGNQSSGL